MSFNFNFFKTFVKGTIFGIGMWLSGAIFTPSCANVNNNTIYHGSITNKGVGNKGSDAYDTNALPQKPTHKKNIAKVIGVKENTGKTVSVKENTDKVVGAKENTGKDVGVKENTATLVSKAPFSDAAEVKLPLKTTLNKDRSRFLQAEGALNRGNTVAYQQLKQELKSYALYPYLLFAEYDRSINTLSFESLLSFLNNYPDTPLAEQLRTRWLQTKAKQENWPEFLKAYVPTNDVHLQCHALWARLNTNQDKQAVLEETIPLWLSGKQPAKSCEAVFHVFEQSTMMTRPMVWQRIKLAIVEGNERLARQMSHFIKHSERALVELWIMIHNNPYLVTHKKYFTSDHPAMLEMIVHGVAQIAKKKPDTAKEMWQNIGKEYPFAERHWGLVVRAIGLSFASQRHPDAEKWLSKVPNIYANQAVHEWRVRVSLAKEDWQSVALWLKNFPEPLAKEEIWQYWNARALGKINREKDSLSIMEKLAESRSFYGFLASQHLNKPYSIAQQKFPLDNMALVQIAKKNCVQRARELYLLGREAKARSEWITAAQYMTDTERHGAAALALQWGLPNWSILALSKATNKNDLSLRFPIVYSEQITRAARHAELDPAFVFALTRQESAFVTNARSSAGALGLMQLMPNTAKLVAQKHQVPLKHMNALLEPDLNVQLGSRYLRMMLNSYQDHPILATAAYNAGPGRIKKWLPSYDMEADSWIETIPYKETREYVKNVMTYTVIYKELLGYKNSKTFKLPYIPAAKAPAANAKVEG